MAEEIRIMDFFIGTLLVLGSGLFAYMSGHMVEEQKRGKRIPFFWENDFKPYDKAGSYGIQDGFSVHIEKIRGCYYNVMGFPISKFYNLYNFILKRNHR